MATAGGRRWWLLSSSGGGWTQRHGTCRCVFFCSAGRGSGPPADAIFWPACLCCGPPSAAQLLSSGSVLLEAMSLCDTRCLLRAMPVCSSHVQVKSVLSSILSSVQQQVAQRSAQQQGSGSDNTLPGYDAAVAAKWAAANPPGSCGCCSSGGGDASSSEQGPSQEESQPEGEGAVQQQQQQHQAGGSSQPLCLHYYSPALHAQLSEVYSKARALLQPTPPVVEPPKKGERGGEGGRCSRLLVQNF